MRQRVTSDWMCAHSAIVALPPPTFVDKTHMGLQLSTGFAEIRLVRLVAVRDKPFVIVMSPGKSSTGGLRVWSALPSRCSVGNLAAELRRVQASLLLSSFPTGALQCGTQPISVAMLSVAGGSRTVLSPPQHTHRAYPHPHCKLKGVALLSLCRT